MLSEKKGQEHLESKGTSEQREKKFKA